MQKEKESKKTKQPKEHKQNKNKHINEMDYREMMKRDCYFLYYYFLYYEPKATIVINRNRRKVSTTSQHAPNYACDCIMKDDKCLYEMGVEYKLVFDEKLKINTVAFNSKTGLPMPIKSLEYENKGEYIRRAYQQHILYHEINKNLKQISEELVLKPKSRKWKEISTKWKSKIQSIEIETHVVIENDVVHETPFDVFSESYKSIVSAIAKLFDIYLNKENQLAEILVLGDSIKNTGLNEKEHYYFQIKRDDFLTYMSTEMQFPQSKQLNYLPLTSLNLQALPDNLFQHFIKQIEIDEKIKTKKKITMNDLNDDQKYQIQEQIFQSLLQRNSQMSIIQNYNSQNFIPENMIYEENFENNNLNDVNNNENTFNQNDNDVNNENKFN